MDKSRAESKVYPAALSIRGFPIRNLQAARKLSIKRVLPKLKLIEGLNQKGLFTYGGQPKPGVVSTVARMYKALPSD